MHCGAAQWAAPQAFRYHDRAAGRNFSSSLRSTAPISAERNTRRAISVPAVPKMTNTDFLGTESGKSALDAIPPEPTHGDITSGLATHMLPRIGSIRGVKFADWRNVGEIYVT